MRARWTPWLPALLTVVALMGGGLSLASGAPISAAVATPTLPAADVSPTASPTAPPAPANGPVQVAPGYELSSGVSVVGELPAAAPISVAVGLPSQDPEGLAAFVAAAAVPGTSAYHHFLSAPAAAAQYGASPALVAAVRDYFQGYGLNATASPDGLLVDVSGGAGGAGRAFGTTFDEYVGADGRTFVSHPTPAVLPASLQATGVYGLGNATPLVPDVGLSSAVPGPAPEASDCTALTAGLSPCQIASVYDIAPLETNGTNGTGYRIAVVDAYSSKEGQSQMTDDLAEFTEEVSIPVGTVNYVYPVPTSTNLNTSGLNSGWALEDALDIEWARASAPGATIDMTLSPNAEAGLYEAIDWLVANDAANVISMSWGEPDVGVFNAATTPCSVECNATTDGSYEVLGPVLELGAAEGITFFASSGDCGAADGTSGVSTNFPASDPYVTGVGGTVLTVGTNNTWDGETAWSGNTSGTPSPGCNNEGGSGGGYSPAPEPWWQSGISDPGHLRGVPDVAMDGDTPVGIVLDGASAGVYGTSLGTPIWSGIAAIADQAAGQSLGLLNPSLYSILRSSDYASDFHDIVAGNNGYAAGPGWDPVTGVGTPIVAALVPNLVRGGGLPGDGLTANVYASPRSGHAPLTVEVAVNASGGTGTYPLEGVAFGDGTSALWNGTTLSHTYSVDGDYLVQSFAADSSGNLSTSLPVLVAVGGGALGVTLTASPNATTVGSPVDFSAAAVGGTPPYSYQYYFGDGAYTLAVPGPVAHPYAVAGGFCAEVVATDDADPTDAGVSARVSVAVGGAATPNCGDGSTPLSVVPNATGRILDAPADYGDSLFRVTGGLGAPDGLGPSTALVSNDSYIAACGCAIFRHPGNFSVTEWANDTVDGSVSATENITVAPTLDATFAASTLTGFAPLKVYYFSSEKGGYEANANLTEWNFGNGDTATGHSVNTTYEFPGEYLAIGRLSDRGGGNGSEAFLIDVEPATGLTLGVAATISPALDVPSGGTVRFTATAEGPPGATANTQLLWNLGAGHSAYGSPVSETYYVPAGGVGNNTVEGEVTVMTSYLNPAYSTGFDLPSFFAVEPGGFVPAADALEGAVNVTPSENLVPFPIFGNLTATGPHPISLSWNFGDGSTGTGAAAEHELYAAQGYNVEGLVGDAYGDSASLLTAVSANGPLGIAGGPSPGSGPKPLTVTIATAAYGGKGPPYHYDWTFVNGSHSTSSTAHLYFPAVGTYTVHLNVTDRSGAFTERNFTIVVGYPAPYAAAAILAGSAAAGGMIAVFVRFTRHPRKPKPGDDPWLDHPRTASDGTPVW